MSSVLSLTPSSLRVTSGASLSIYLYPRADTPSSILRGNLAPGGCVSKITGKEGLEFTGKARVFDNEDEVAKAIEQKTIKVGEKTVIVLRYLGPKGGPGECHRPAEC